MRSLFSSPKGVVFAVVMGLIVLSAVGLEVAIVVLTIRGSMTIDVAITTSLGTLVTAVVGAVTMGLRLLQHVASDEKSDRVGSLMTALAPALASLVSPQPASADTWHSDPSYRALSDVDRAAVQHAMAAVASQPDIASRVAALQREAAQHAGAPGQFLLSLASRWVRPSA